MKSSSPYNLSTRKGSRRSYGARRGFTLVELMVVLAIAAVVTSITVSGFRSLTDGNQRTTCQTNMSQLYASLRLYAADEGGAFPYYDGEKSGTGASDGERGIGLWVLYTFPDANDSDELAPVAPDPGTRPLERYLRSPKVLHCPADFDVELADGTTLNRESLTIPDPSDATRRIYNRDYLSYHSFDNGTPDDIDDDEQLYKPIRTTVQGASGSAQRDLWKRQLLPALPDATTDSDTIPEIVNRPPTSDTIVTWCPWHRGVRDVDNVLFYDGSVQILPRDQDGRTKEQRLPNDPK